MNTVLPCGHRFIGGSRCHGTPEWHDGAPGKHPYKSIDRRSGTDRRVVKGRGPEDGVTLVPAIEAEASAPSPETLALVRGARNLSDRRTLDGDGFWVSQKEMRALDIALDAWLAEAEAGRTG